MNLIHVVRRYGPVGGMERYVWELVLELQKLGHQITVLCERCHVEKPAGISIVELGETTKRPRWLSQLRFSGRVARWVHENKRADRIIHSHERLGVHHVTTFHGPPFATIRDKSWWRLISLRVWMRLYLERRELETARAIVPNSMFISRQLARYYPEMAEKLHAPIAPGVSVARVREQKVSGGKVVCFAGWEWQRKGLPKAVEIVAALRRMRPDIKFRVVGPNPADIKHLFEGWNNGYLLSGWQSDNTFLSEVDVLLHPANAEPYGMVISEAMAAGVPVVISDVCGASEHVSPDSGSVLALSAHVDEWVAAVANQLDRSEPVPRFERSWCDVAKEYELVYREILAGLK